MNKKKKRKPFLGNMAFKKLFCLGTAVGLALCVGYVHQTRAVEDSASASDYEEDKTDKTSNVPFCPEYLLTGKNHLPASTAVSYKLTGVTDQDREISEEEESDDMADYWKFNRSIFYVPGGCYVLSETKSDNTKVLPNHNRYLVRIYDNKDPVIHCDENLDKSMVKNDNDDIGIHYKEIKTDTIYVRVSQTGGGTQSHWALLLYI